MKNNVKPWRWFLAGAVACAAVVGGWGFSFILNDDTGMPLRWPSPSADSKVRIRIMVGSDRTLSDGKTFNSSAQEAADIWNARMGAVQFQSTTASGTAGDNNDQNEMVFAAKVFDRDFGSDVLAVTTAWYIGNERTEGDIIFDSTETWDSYRGSRSGSVDFRRVAIHELGHLLGMDHPDEADPAQSVSAIMNSRISAVDTLTNDDISGIQALYGPPGTPPNNNFASATEITLNSGLLTVSGYNTNATKEAAEPSHAGNIGGKSVWWRWRPASNGDVTIDTKGSRSDTLLAVYTGTSLAALNAVASDDDIEDGINQVSTVTFRVTANTTYLIAVDGFNGGDSSGADCSGLTLNFNFTPTSGSAPTITTNPSGATVDIGGSATFSVAAVGTEPFTYQWRLNEVAIAGATNANYSLSNIQIANAGTYSAVVSNPVGNATSSGAVLIVRSTPLPPTSGGGGGGGGGGAPSLWFCAVLAALGLGRLLQRGRR